MPPDNETIGSVTYWISELRKDNPEAVEMIWIRFVSRLAHIAEQKMKNSVCRTSDADLIAAKAFVDFFDRDPNDFEKLVNRNDLWQILVMITERRVVDEIRRITALKRGGGAVVGEGDIGSFSMIAGDCNTPDKELMMVEAFEDRLNSLKDPLLQQIAIGKMENRSNAELAERHSTSLRTIERKLADIRRIWTS